MESSDELRDELQIELENEAASATEESTPSSYLPFYRFLEKEMEFYKVCDVQHDSTTRSTNTR